MIYAAAVIAPARRRAWARRLATKAPERFTIAAAADLLGVDRELLRRYLSGAARRQLRLDVAMTRDRVVELLRA